MTAYNIRKESDTENLRTTISIHRNGKKVFTWKFGALSHIYKLSSSGRYFVISLANSQHKDSGKVFLFDIQKNELLFSKILNVGGIYDLFFLNEDENLYITNSFGSYQIDQNGNTDMVKVHADAVFSSKTESIHYIDAFLDDNNYSEESIRTSILSLDKIIDEQYNQFHGKSWAAVALRKRGELLEKVNENDEAFLNYIDALYLDPKVGVKKRLASLGKNLGLNIANFQPSERAKRIESSCNSNREITMEKSKQDWKEFEKRNNGEFELSNTLVIPCEKVSNKPTILLSILFFIFKLIKNILIKPIVNLVKFLSVTTMKALMLALKVSVYVVVIYI
ncbi:hypothetical protein, partial [Rodentibacter ratti]|uniref:hypothetical protein n=1 Tax=Rodentibacter ratti TaxID=1906745 RepID=UPI00117B8B86